MNLQYLLYEDAYNRSTCELALNLLTQKLHMHLPCQLVLRSLSLSFDSSSSTLVSTVSIDDELAPLAAGSMRTILHFAQRAM